MGESNSDPMVQITLTATEKCGFLGSYHQCLKSNVAIGKYFSFTVRLLHFSADFGGKVNQGGPDGDCVPLSPEAYWQQMK